MAKFERKEKSQPKHKPTASSGASKAPRPPPVQQPGWKGPTYLYKKPARPSPSSSQAVREAGPKLQPQALPAELQQLVLDVFRDTFPASLDFDALKPTLQAINAALVAKRDWGLAFGTEEFREAYAIRWGPSRALCYANLLADLATGGGGGSTSSSSNSSSSSAARDESWLAGFLDGASEVGRLARRVVCIGGGASEVMAFGALLKHHAKPEAPPSCSSSSGTRTQELTKEGGGDQGPSATVDEHDRGHGRGRAPCPLHVTLVDAANWASVAAKLERGLKTPPALSKYASATARANNAALIGVDSMRVTCCQVDVLAPSGPAVKEVEGKEEEKGERKEEEEWRNSSSRSLQALIGADADPVLITLLFTLNDLYAASIPKTTRLLAEMSVAAPRGSLLLVVDSIGACVEPAGRTAAAAAGAEGKRYPMAWLMDHLLLDKGKAKVKNGEEAEAEAEAEEEEGRNSEPAWAKVMGDESRLFRLDEGLKYPASLENLRFQVHLFRRL